MRLSAKAHYACLAVLHLAERADRTQPVHMKEIAERKRVPYKYLAQILLQLKGARLVRSVRGSDGGYELERDPRSVTLWDVVAAVDGDETNILCVDKAGQWSCDCAPECALRPAWLEAVRKEREVLESHSFRELAEAARSPAKAMYEI